MVKARNTECPKTPILVKIARTHARTTHPTLHLHKRARGRVGMHMSGFSLARTRMHACMEGYDDGARVHACKCAVPVLPSARTHIDVDLNITYTYIYMCIHTLSHLPVLPSARTHAIRERMAHEAHECARMNLRAWRTWSLRQSRAQTHACTDGN